VRAVDALRAPKDFDRPIVGLVLTGGGARAAYHIGVLRALTELLPGGRNPFRIVVGTSAGAVAAAVLASQAYRWRQAVFGLEDVWANFRVSQVFRVDSLQMLRDGLHWMLALATGGLVLTPPRSVLDNSPLRALLGAHVQWSGVRRSIERGHLRAVGLCATSYGTGQSVAFYDGTDDISDWARTQRCGKRTELTLEHLMASVGIPLLFPPVRLAEEYYGDGAMRQLNPLSPAVHLGADRLLVVGVRARHAAGVAAAELPVEAPTPGQIFGFMLDTLFTDQIFSDLEELERFNELKRVAPRAAPELRVIETLMLAPSVDPREVAARHVAEMRGGLRALLRVLGAGDLAGSQLASYLMFEAAYTRDLIALGYRDAMQARSALTAFMSGERLPPVLAAPGVAHAT
jgi:NTE family protein